MGPSQINYSDYLKLDNLLALQQPLSNKSNISAHEEHLFIIVHQAHELWFKQVHHDLDSVMQILNEQPVIDERKMGTCLARVGRISKIFRTLIDHLKILETMSPLDFLDFRDLLVPASGFQSLQFRGIEVKLGSLTKSNVCPVGGGKSFYTSALRPQDADSLKHTAGQMSLYQMVERWLERAPFLDNQGYKFWSAYKEAVVVRFKQDANAIRSDPCFEQAVKSQQMDELKRNEKHFETLFDLEKHNEMIEAGSRRMSLRATHAALFIELYRDQPLLQLPYSFLNQLIELDDSLQDWRAEHTSMVHRMIGAKVGTGGSMGYPYLKTTLGHTRVFGDLLHIPTFLIPRSHLPPLPEGVKKQLSFFGDF